MTAPGTGSLAVDRPGQGSIVDALGVPASSLTPRQREAVYLVASGLTYAEAAAVMCISMQSFKNHMHSAYERLDVGGIVPAMHVLGLVR